MTSTVIDFNALSRAERSKLPIAPDVVRAVAEEHGVCIRPLAMRRIDTETGRVDVIPMACGSTLNGVCPPCAEKNRRLRMAQCREGWHLAAEPELTPEEPNADQKSLVELRADLVAEYRAAAREGDECGAEEIRDAVTSLDAEIRQLGVRGSLPPLDPVTVGTRHRSTKRRQDAPDLPRRPVEKRTVGRVFAGKYRPSTFVTLTLDSYGMVHADGMPVDPASYDYRRAARDAVHFAALLDRFVQNLRRGVGWEVQYFSTVEPQRRLAPHWHAAIRGAIPRAELRAVAAATYHQVWWPQHDELKYGGDRVPFWDEHAKAFVDPDTRRALPTWEEALDHADEPAHVVRFGRQVHAKGILGGTEEAGRHIGYLTKYLTKAISEIHEPQTDRERAHLDRLHAELRVTPCSPRCPIWLLYGVQPKGARQRMVPGECKAKAHKRDTLGLAGRRVLVSRKWSGKSLTDHKRDRQAFVRDVLAEIGVQAEHTPRPGRFIWEKTAPGDTDVPPRLYLLLSAVAERQKWKADYLAAQLAAQERNCSATDQAA